MLRHLMGNQQKIEKYMEQLYTGKKISRPSDDPVIAMKGINYRSRVKEIEQYKRNTGEVYHWMDHSESALNESVQAMQRMRELAVQASNSTYSDEELDSIKKEVEQLKEHLIDLVNTNVNGKYIFNGTNTKEQPLQMIDGELHLPDETSPVMIEVYKSTQIQANIDTEEIFNEEFFASIDRFIGHLEQGEAAPDDPVDIGDSLRELDEGIDQLIKARADLGARMNRLELIEERLEDQKIVATKTMSENEDIHFEEAITNLITQESLYRAALATGARMIQPTLMDFLK